MHSCAQTTEPARAATRPHSAWLRRRLARWPTLAAHSAPHAKKATRKARPVCYQHWLSRPVTKIRLLLFKHHIIKLRSHASLLSSRHCT